ncbi:hypothetical protein LNJ03_11235 [Tenacibaculum dicentrarchi]|nr:hypothetical protein [Tenacibaculum dicentrarchi]
MSKQIHDEQLKLDIIINGNDAQKKLGDLEKQQKSLGEKTKDLATSKKELDLAIRSNNDSLTQTNKILKSNTNTLKSNIESQKMLGLKIDNLEDKQKELLEVKKKLEKAGETESKQYALVSKRILKNTQELSKNKSEKESLIEAQGWLNKSIDTYNKKSEDLQDVLSKNKKSVNVLKEELKDLKDVNSQNKEAQKKYREELGLTGLTKKQLAKESKRLKSVMDSFTPKSEQWNKYASDLSKVEKQLGEVKDEYNEVKDSLNDGEDFGKAQESFANIMTGLKTGDLGALKTGFIGLSGGIKTATKSAIAFIFTPLGATLATLAGVIGAGKMWFDYNVGLSKTLKLTEQLTGLQGQDLSDYRAQIQGIASTFDKEYNEVLKAANSLSKKMEITQQEALSKIEQGLVRGADANGDFLDKVKEYPVHFKNAGHSAQDFIDIAVQEVKGATYNDKLLDTIKEIDLSLRDMDKAQRDVLEANFGKKFAKDLIKGVESGKTTTKQAFDSIIAKSKEMGLNVLQQQKLVADLMKSAGEDAGGYKVVIEQLNLAFDKQNKKLSESEKATLRLSKANKEQEQAMADLFDASKSGFPAMLTNLKAIGSEIFTNTLRGFKQMITSQEKLNEASGLKGQSVAVKQVSENMKLYGTTAIEEVDSMLKSAKKNIDRIKRDLDNVGFFSGITGEKGEREKSLSKAKGFYNELLKIKTGKSAKFKEANKPEEEEYIAPIKPVVDPKKKDASDEMTPEDKKIMESKKKLAEFVDEWHEDQHLQEELRKLEKSEREEEEEVIRKDNEFEEKILEAEGDLALQSELEEIRESEIALIRQKWADKKIEDKKKEDKKFAAADKKAKEGLIKAEQGLEAAKAKAMQTGVQLLGNIFGKKSAIYKLMFGLEKAMAISEIITATGKSIALAKAQDAAVPAVLPPGIPNPMKAISLATMGASVAAAKINAGVQIATIVGTAVQGFEDGLYPVTRDDGKTFQAKLGTTKTGLVTEPTLMDGKYLAGERSTARNPEMIIDDITFSKLDPNVIQYITNVHKGIVPGHEKGIYKAPKNSTESFDYSDDDEVDLKSSISTGNVEKLLKEVVSGIENIKLVFGYEEVEKIFGMQAENESSKENGILSK